MSIKQLYLEYCDLKDKDSINMDFAYLYGFKREDWSPEVWQKYRATNSKRLRKLKKIEKDLLWKLGDGLFSLGNNSFIFVINSKIIVKELQKDED